MYCTTNMQTEKSNKWISFTYTGNETARVSNVFKKVDKNMNISFKINNKFNNILFNKIENLNITFEGNI